MMSGKPTMQERSADEGRQYVHALKTIVDLRSERDQLLSRLESAQLIIDAAPKDGHGEPLHVGCRIWTVNEGRLIAGRVDTMNQNGPDVTTGALILDHPMCNGSYIRCYLDSSELFRNKPEATPDGQ